MTQTTAICVSNLNITNSAGQDIIRDLSFEIESGSIVGLLGESGAGKTVLGRAMTSCLPWGLVISSGKIRVDGGTKRVTMVPQLSQASLPPLMTVQNLIANVLTWNGKNGSSREVYRVLGSVGFPSSLDPKSLRPHQLSGGLAQRVALGAAFATSPKTLILDEPTSSLDPISSKELTDVLLSLNQEYDTTFLIISHNLPWLEKICSGFLLIKSGGYVCEGKMNNIENSSNTYLKRFIHANELPKASLQY